jgi:hypothetical protein
MTQQQTDELTLEQILDRHSLRWVIRSLAEICSGKAEHLRCNWQDEPAAKSWDKDADKLDVVVVKLTN